MSAKTQNPFRIYLSPPHLSDHEKTLLIDALDSGWVAPLGPHVDAFENELAAYVGVKAGLALSSGTAAIHLALKVLGIKKGDHILTSSLTFVGTVNPILYEGAIPVFVDSEPESWNLCPEALESAIADLKKRGIRPAALIPVDLYGQCARYGRIEAICTRENIPIIEDAAEALGARLDRKPAGQFGKLSILSFNGNKIITTSGGGMLLSDDEKLIGEARAYSTQSREKVPYYQHTRVGYNYRMSNLLAAVGRGQLRTLDERVNRRREIFGAYLEALGRRPEAVFMPEYAGSHSSRWLSTLYLDPARTDRTPDHIMDAMKGQGIEARHVWKPMHLQPLFKGCEMHTARSSGTFAEFLFERGVCLPSGSQLKDAEQREIIQIFEKALG